MFPWNIFFCIESCLPSWNRPYLTMMHFVLYILLDVVSLYFCIYEIKSILLEKYGIELKNAVSGTSLATY